MKIDHNRYLFCIHIINPSLKLMNQYYLVKFLMENNNKQAMIMGEGPSELV